MSRSHTLPAVSGGAALDRVWLSRSLLFVPGSRPDRFAKAVAAGPGLLILDLEDAVGAADKDAARADVRTWLQAGNLAMVRINPTSSPWYDDDVAMVAAAGAPVMLPKCEHAGQITDLAAALGDGVGIVALIETAAGVLAARDICAAGVARVAFGAADLSAQLGVDPADSTAMLAARSQLVLASAAAGIAGPIDSPTFTITDDSSWRADAAHAKRLGYTGKLCIHPRQVEATEETFAPTKQELQWAREVIDSVATRGAVTTVAGSMVDAPVVERARRLLNQLPDASTRCDVPEGTPQGNGDWLAEEP
jgi:citrate lyase subunit beta / citryl-CoA lyase